MIKNQAKYLQVIDFHGKNLKCEMSHNKPVINDDNTVFTSIPELLKEYPTLTRVENITALCQAINFLSGGLEYQFIDDIPKYQEEYLNQVEFEKNSLDYNPNRLIDHGVFDINDMRGPRIHEGVIVFYVKNSHNSIPYKVTYSLSDEKNNLPRYELLKYAED